MGNIFKFYQFLLKLYFVYSHRLGAAAPLFDDGNLAASKSPKVKARRGDAYRTLLQTTGQYDVIVSEPSNPWVTGVEMLFSREFLEAARDRLAPGGSTRSGSTPTK